MPTYEYKCTVCQNHFDVEQSFTDDALTTLPGCEEAADGEHQVKKVFSAVGISFKGEGFYRNDSRSGSSRSGSGSDNGTSSSSDGGSSGSSSDQGSSSTGDSGSTSSSSSSSSSSGSSSGSDSSSSSGSSSGSGSSSSSGSSTSSSSG